MSSGIQSVRGDFHAASNPEKKTESPGRCYYLDMNPMSYEGPWRALNRTGMRRRPPTRQTFEKRPLCTVHSNRKDNQKAPQNGS
jgi:hypothetical protein